MYDGDPCVRVLKGCQIKHRDTEATEKFSVVSVSLCLIPGQWVMNVMMGSACSHTHQPALGVVQDVDLEHPQPFGAGPVVVADDDAQGLLVRHIDSVLPGNRPGRLAFIIEDLEEKSMQMKRVRPLGFVLD